MGYRHYGAHRLVDVPNFIIHAAGSLGNRPDLGKKPYRLKCRFQIPAYSGERLLERAKYAAAEAFIADMAVKGWQYIGESSRLAPDARGFRMTFMGAHVEIMSSVKRPKRPPSSAKMQAAVMQGATFRAPDDEGASVRTVPHFAEAEFWDYELAGVFLRDTLLMEVPDLHEERRPAS